MSYQLLQGDCLTILQTLPAASVHCCVTSPPYFGLRDYGVAGQIGLESTVSEYVDKMVQVFRGVRRVLRDDGTVFLNLGDSYMTQPAGNKKPSGFQQKSKAGQSGALAQFTPLGVRRAKPYGTSGKAPEGYQDRDCLCGNLCDVCRVVYRSRKSHNDDLLAAMLVASLSAPNHEHKESASDHLPTSDLLHQATRNAHAIQDRPLVAPLAGEQLRAALVSTIGESYPQLLDVCLQRAVASECLLCGRSLGDCVPGYAHKLDGLQGQGRHSQGSALLDAQQERHSQCTDMVCEYCTGIGSYPHYTTAYQGVQLKPKDLIGIPWRVAFALQADGWYLRSDIIWHKPNPMPESVTDRPTKSHEYLFLLAKSERYFYDAQAIAEPITQSSIERISQPTFASQTGGSKDYRNGINPNRSMRQTLENFAGNGSATRNKRSVWTVATRPYKEAHFATYPVDLVEPCILAGCPAGGTVLDPFNGSGTTGVAAIGLGRQYIGIEINPEYIRLAERRLGETQPALLAI